jgi:hypothetical protein
MQHKDDIAVADEEVSLMDVIRFFKQHRRWMAACVLMSILGTALYWEFKPNVFEASATIQMAMVDNEAVEKPAQLNEKIKLPLYFTTATLQNCANDGKASLTGSLADLLKTKAIPNTPFLNISIKMSSVAQINICMDSILTDIQNQQALLAAPEIQKQKALQEKLKSKLALAEEASTYFSQHMTQKTIYNEEFSAAAMLLATSSSKEHEIRALSLELMELEISMSSIHTKPASLIAPTYTSDKPIGLQAWQALLFAAVFGFFVGALTAWMKSAWLAVNLGLRTKP